MISDLDIYRAANLPIRQHGADAEIEVARAAGSAYLAGREPKSGASGV